MENLRDCFIDKPELFEKLMKEPVKISIKYDGVQFQVYFNDETGKIEYHKKSKKGKVLGPKIDNITKLFGRRYVNAINQIEEHKSEIADYAFISFEAMENGLVLLSAITKNGEFLKSVDRKFLADKIGAKMPLVIFDDKLNEKQKEAIVGICQDMTKCEHFKTYMYDTFGTNPNFPTRKWEEYPNKLEGVVFTYKIGGKVMHYKLIDPTFTAAKKQSAAEVQTSNAKYKADAVKLVDMMLDWMDKNAKQYSQSYWQSLNENFKAMIEDYKLINAMMNITGHMPLSEIDFVDSMLDKDIRSKIKLMGSPLKTLYENYLIIFHSPKMEAYIIDEQHQKRINEIITRI